MQVTMDQVRELADRYEQCGLGESSSGRFLRSVVAEGRMPRGRGIAWLNDLITKGTPADVAPLVAEIEDLISRSSRADTQEHLQGMLRKIRAGWDLSEHQKATLGRLREQVNDAKPDLELDERQVQLIRGLEARKRYMSPYYWAARPAISKRLDEIFIRWTIDKKVSPDDWEYLCDRFKTCIQDLGSDKHPVGALRWTHAGEPVTVMSEMSFNQSGRIVVSILRSGGVETIDVERLLIRCPSKRATG